MASFGKKLRDCREAKELSQAELARKISAHHSIIGRYERDEVKPTIDVVKKLADILNVTAGYLLGETENDILFKDPDMLKRFQEIDSLNEEDKKCLLANVDAFLRDAKTRQAYATK
jgi:transcriptional regulator with XRE-family HTH domain